MNAIPFYRHNKRYYSENNARAVKHRKHKTQKSKNQRRSVKTPFHLVFAISGFVRSVSRYVGSSREIVFAKIILFKIVHL